MAFPETEKLNAQPPIPFAEGQKLGSQGAPISPELADGYVMYLDMIRRFAELSMEEREAFSRAGARASSRSELERGFAQTDMEKALDAAMTIAGYTSKGLPSYLTGISPNGNQRMSIVEMAVLNPELIAVSADGMRAYMSGYDLQRPAHLEDGEIYKGNISVEDAHALGFIVRAATHGVSVHREDIPEDESQWRAFEAGVDKNAVAADGAFSEVLSEAIESGRELVTLQAAFILGKKVSAGSPKSA